LADRAIARENDDFDCDPWLCTVRNGTLDLRTGLSLPPDQKDMITKLAPVVYDPSAKCPKWLEFLDMIMMGRKNLTGYIKRAFGSCLTGITSDKAMNLLFGGRGGKR
jgi:putative DNA primase/helicase